jgi:hypothetical protein
MTPQSESLFTFAFDREVEGRICYADEQGSMTFSVETRAGGQIFLHPLPLVKDKPISVSLLHAPRYVLARERTKQFLIKRGFDVAMDDC